MIPSHNDVHVFGACIAIDTRVKEDYTMEEACEPGCGSEAGGTTANYEDVIYF
jgi:hypothetical protein